MQCSDVQKGWRKRMGPTNISFISGRKKARLERAIVNQNNNNNGNPLRLTNPFDSAPDAEAIRTLRGNI